MLERTQTLNYFKLQSGQGPKHFLELVAEELLSPWDLEEQASPEIFLVGKQASPEKLYLGC